MNATNLNVFVNQEEETQEGATPETETETPMNQDAAPEEEEKTEEDAE